MHGLSELFGKAQVVSELSDNRRVGYLCLFPRLFGPKLVTHPNFAHKRWHLLDTTSDIYLAVLSEYCLYMKVNLLLSTQTGALTTVLGQQKPATTAVLVPGASLVLVLAVGEGVGSMCVVSWEVR